MWTHCVYFYFAVLWVAYVLFDVFFLNGCRVSLNGVKAFSLLLLYWISVLWFRYRIPLHSGDHQNHLFLWRSCREFDFGVGFWFQSWILKDTGCGPCCWPLLEFIWVFECWELDFEIFGLFSEVILFQFVQLDVGSWIASWPAVFIFFSRSNSL